MSEKITRRSFIKQSAALGASTVIGSSIITSCSKGGGAGRRTDVDISVMEFSAVDPYLERDQVDEIVSKAVEMFKKRLEDEK